MDINKYASFLHTSYTDKKKRAAAKYPNKPVWENSKFGWIKSINHNVDKGAIGESLAKYLLMLKGYKVLENKKSSHDFQVKAVDDPGIDIWNVECKLATQGIDSLFKWLSIRIEDNYHRIILVAVYPNQIRFFWLTKEMSVNVKNCNSNGGERNKSHIQLTCDGDFFIQEGGEKKWSVEKYEIKWPNQG